MHERGIIKWLPFNSLNQDNMNFKQKEEMKKPVLLEDTINNLDNNLKESIQTKTKVKIKYYQQNNIYFIIGYISVFKENYIIIKETKIYLRQLLDIKII